jgi:hypothetical protein
MAALTPERPLGAEDSQAENTGFGSLENQGLQEPEIDLSDNLTFQRVNEITWKLTDGRGSNAWSGNRGRGHRTTRAVAWLMGIGAGLWVVRYRDKSSKPMKLPKAKTYALEMVKGIRPGKVIADPIGRLQRLQLDVLEPTPKSAEVWAIETADYPPPYSRPLEAAEGPKSGECPLEYYPDGYPVLPDSLRRLASS